MEKWHIPSLPRNSSPKLIWRHLEQCSAHCLITAYIPFHYVVSVLIFLKVCGHLRWERTGRFEHILPAFDWHQLLLTLGCKFFLANCSLHNLAFPFMRLISVTVQIGDCGRTSCV